MYPKNNPNSDKPMFTKEQLESILKLIPEGYSGIDIFTRGQRNLELREIRFDGSIGKVSVFFTDDINQ